MADKQFNLNTKDKAGTSEAYTVVSGQTHPRAVCLYAVVHFSHIGLIVQPSNSVFNSVRR